MTAIVGVLCTDGVVIGSDSSATFGLGPQFKTVEQPTDKLEIVGSKIIIAGTGQIGLGQRFKRIVDLAWTAKSFKDDPVDICRQLAASTIQDFATTQTGKGQYGALMAFPAAKKAQLCEFASPDFNPEQKAHYPRIWWASMGSGIGITDPFLALLREVFWSKSQPNIREGVFAVLWAIQHAIECNPGGVNGPARLATLRTSGSDLKAELLTDADLAEHHEAIDEAKNGLRVALQKLSSPKVDPAALDVPKPEATKG